MDFYTYEKNTPSILGVTYFEDSFIKHLMIFS